jgi:hypothetical protein
MQKGYLFLQRQFLDDHVGARIGRQGSVRPGIVLRLLHSRKLCNRMGNSDQNGGKNQRNRAVPAY